MESLALSPPEYAVLSGHFPAGFWQRFFAFLIDVIVVTIPCFTLTEIFHDFLLKSPIAGKLIGFAIVVCYFAIFASELVDGQTLGMMVLGLKVAKRDGSTPSLAVSLGRYSIFFIPILLSSEILPARTPSLLVNSYQTLMVAAATVIYYLAIFNRGTGQSLHDLATNTFVVDCPGAGSVHAEEFWKPHWGIIVALLVSSYAATLILSRTSPTFSELTVVQNSVQQATKLGPIRVTLKSSGDQSGLIVDADCSQISDDHGKASQAIARIVLTTDPQVKDHDYLQVACVTNLSVGFFRSNRRDWFTHSPEQWEEIVTQK